MARQGSNGVAKSNPEMQAVLANIDSLVDELQSLSMADGLDDGGGDLTQEPPPVRGMASASKGEEPFRTPAAPQVATSPKAPANDAGMAQWQGETDPEENIKKAMKIMKEAGYNFEKPEDKEGDEVLKAAKALVKSLQSTPSEGPEANLDGDDRLEEMGEPDEENIEEVKKALAKILGIGGRTARKSAPSNPIAAANKEMLSVMKSMADRLQTQDAILSEVLEGLGIANTVTKSDAPQGQTQVGTRSVQKSQGGPVMQYGNELGDLIGQAVAKALAPIVETQQNANRPNGWNTENLVRKNLGEVTIGLGQLAGTQWGERPLNQKEGE